MRKEFVILLICAYQCAGHVFEINESDYGRMPPLLTMESFDSCLQKTDDVYCMVEFTLVSEGDSELLSLIKKYSEHTLTRFNHSIIRRGLCVSETCEEFHRRGSAVTKLQLEACLNRSFDKNYNLRTSVNSFSCSEYGAKVEELENADICVGFIVTVLVFLAIIGSFIDVLFTKSEFKVHSLLINFSLIHNFKRLTASYEEVTDSRRNLYKCLHGVKVLMACIVIVGHSGDPNIKTMKNVHLMEEYYNYLPRYLFFNGTMVVQTYFVISGMLLIYKLQLYAEENKIGIHLLPKAIAIKWMRQTPQYAVAILITATWLRFLKSGPFWEDCIGEDISDCRQRGWLGLVYLNNYALNSQCLPHTWHLAADMQLFCCGFFIYFLARNSDRKKFILTLSFLISLLITAVVTYTLDLDALIIVSPKNILTFFGSDPTYNSVYKKGYTNLPCYVIGIILGYLIYHLNNSNFRVDRYKKYRIVYWLLLPACCVPLLLGSVFYHEPKGILLRVLFATFAKPIFGLMIAVLIFGMVFKYETVYRGFFEWSGWLPLSRLSYCAFIVHLIIIRLYPTTMTELIEMSLTTTLAMLATYVFGSFAVAVPLWFLVEAPVTGLLNSTTPKENYTESNIQMTNGSSKTGKLIKQKAI